MAGQRGRGGLMSPIRRVVPMDDHRGVTYTCLKCKTPYHADEYSYEGTHVPLSAEAAKEAEDSGRMCYWRWCPTCRAIACPAGYVPPPIGGDDLDKLAEEGDPALRDYWGRVSVGPIKD